MLCTICVQPVDPLANQYQPDVFIEFFCAPTALFKFVFLLLEMSIQFILLPHLIVQSVLVHLLLAIDGVQCLQKGCCSLSSFLFQSMVLFNLQ